MVTITEIAEWCKTNMEEFGNMKGEITILGSNTIKVKYTGSDASTTYITRTFYLDCRQNQSFTWWPKKTKKLPSGNLCTKIATNKILKFLHSKKTR